MPHAEPSPSPFFALRRGTAHKPDCHTKTGKYHRTYSDNVRSLDVQLFHQDGKENAAQLRKLSKQGKPLRRTTFRLRNKFAPLGLFVERQRAEL